MCSLTISNGGVQNLVSRTQAKVEQAAQVIHEQLKRFTVVAGSDEAVRSKWYQSLAMGLSNT
ncbi:MAG: hypothetical protein Q9P01_10800 [Anaerolineae bacterium]|nr:hypothetical protein [Anaerolineae bacterium]